MANTNAINNNRNKSAIIDLVSGEGSGDESVGSKSISEILGVSGPGGADGSGQGANQPALQPRQNETDLMMQRGEQGQGKSSL